MQTKGSEPDHQPATNESGHPNINHQPNTNECGETWEDDLAFFDKNSNGMKRTKQAVGSHESDNAQQSLDPVGQQVVREQVVTEQVSTKSLVFVKYRTFVSFAFLLFALCTLLQSLSDTITFLLSHSLPLQLTFASNNDVPFALNDVREVEERSAPLATLQDTEQEGVTPSIASTPSQSEIISKPEPNLYHLKNTLPQSTRMQFIPQVYRLKRLSVKRISQQAIHELQIYERHPPASAFQMKPLKITRPLWWRHCLVKHTILTCFDSHMHSSHAFISHAFIPSRCSISYWTHSHVQFKHVHQLHLFKRSLDRSSIDVGERNPPPLILHHQSESCTRYHSSCNCDGEKRKEAKDSCVRHRKTIQG